MGSGSPFRGPLMAFRKSSNSLSRASRGLLLHSEVVLFAPFHQKPLSGLEKGLKKPFKDLHKAFYLRSEGLQNYIQKAVRKPQNSR